MTPAAPRAAGPVVVIEPRSGWRLVDWRELVEYRELFLFLVWRDVKALYRQSILGFGWAVVQPLVTMMLFVIVFDRLAGVPTAGVPAPLFYFTALVPWTYLNNATTGAANSLVAQSNLLSKVYVPRLVIPSTPVLAKLVDLAVALAVLAVLVGVFHWTSPEFAFRPSPSLLVLPLLLLILVATAAGLGLWLSSLAVRYRDVKFATPFLLQVLVYSAPVVWPVSLVPAPWRPVIGLYPLFGVIEGLRSSVLATGPVPWDLIASGTLGATVLLLSGALFFRRQETTFADVA